MARARDLLEQNGRVSINAFGREFGISGGELEDLVTELTDVVRVAAREGQVLVWRAPASEARPRQTLVEGERRQLTVMLCDLADSTSLARRLDPEEFRELLAAYQSVCTQAIERYEGYIAQYLGDGVLAYFGYPQAHEDAAERALLAGLAIQHGLGRLREGYGSSELWARIGVHTGQVVMGEVGSGDRRETLAVGDTTNVAARLEATARPGSVTVSEATLELAPGLFATQDLGLRELKGVVEPLRIYEVLHASGSTGRFERARARTPLVGRDRELGVLLERWQEARGGEGRVVVLSGEAGVGKSRLLYELRERIGAERHTWLEGRCSPLMSGSAFEPVLTLLREALGIDADGSPQASLAALENGMASRDDGFRSKTVPYLASLLGLPPSRRYPLPPVTPELQRERTFAALIEQLLAAAELRPVVCLYEDLHWADPSTLELFDRTVTRLAGARVLLILTHRNGFERPGLLGSSTTSIELARLERGESRMLAEATEACRELSDAVIDQIVARSDGVPLFVEELAKSVAEASGSSSTDDEAIGDGRQPKQVPSTLQDSLMARLDRLSEAKQVAQIASALGRDFDYTLLARVAELDEDSLQRSLKQLVDAQILDRRSVGTREAYSFAHALLHDTAYQSQLRSTRKRLHARTGEVLERFFPERCDREPGVLANHFRAGGQPSEAASAFQRAGEQAVARVAHGEAARHFREALELLAQLPADVERHAREVELQLALGAALVPLGGYADPDVLAAYQRVETLTDEVGKGPQQLPPLLGVASFYATQGDMLRWGRYGERLLELATELEIPVLQITGHLFCGLNAFSSQPASVAVAHLERARSICAGIDLPPADTSEIDFPSWIGAGYTMSLSFVGEFDRARRVNQECLTRARSLDSPRNLSVVLGLSAQWARGIEDRELTIRLASEGIEVAREYGFHSTELTCRVVGGWARGAGAIEEVREALDRFEALGSLAGLTNHHFTYADLLASSGRWDEAAEALDRAVEVGRRGGDLEGYRANYPVLRAECARRQGASDEEREAILQDALRVTSENGRLLYALRATLGLAELRREQGRHDEARALLSDVCGRFGPGEVSPRLAEARALLAELARGRSA